MSAGDSTFADSIPALYDRYLGPLLFAPYAEYVARKLVGMKEGQLLDGTGIVTEALAQHLPASVEIVATDLHQGMLDHAATSPGTERVKFRQADALSLPFEEARFDALICQFGVMFYPDRTKGHREARRVLKPGGRYLFSLWGSLDSNPIARCVADAVAWYLPTNPQCWLERTPYGYYDRDLVRRDLTQAGFRLIDIESVTLPSRAQSCSDVALGFCLGSPMRGEIEAVSPQAVTEMIEVVTAALAQKFGKGPLEATMQALIVQAR